MDSLTHFHISPKVGLGRNS